HSIKNMSPNTALNASEFIADALKGAFLSSQLSNYSQIIDIPLQPPPWQTWGIGLAVMCACTFSAPLGMLLLPCLSRSVYERTMTFLIAVGIGALSGSCFFVMIPQAFQLTSVEELDYESKSWLIISALYTFLCVDRVLQYILEFRRRRQMRRKIHASTLGKILEGGKTRYFLFRQVTEQTDLEDERERKEKEEIQNELEISMLSNAFSRTFSTRRHVAVLSGVDDIEFVGRDSPRSRRPVVETNGCNGYYDEEMGDKEKTPNNHLTRVTISETNSPLGTRKAHQINHNAFLDQVNENVKQHLQPLPFHNSPHGNSSNNNNVENGTKKVAERDDEISVDIQVVEKRILKTAEVEVASVVYMIIFGSSANNFVDGMSMGAAFSDSIIRGLSIGIAVVSQQFPQELGTLAILVKSGLGLKNTLLLNLIPTFLSFAGFTAGVFLDNIDESFDTYIFAVSSGMYLYIFLGTLIPEIRESANELIRTNLHESLIVSGLQCTGIASGIFFMHYLGKFRDISLE
ncbi:hypothetical protein PFISCL1PPCAC_2407, partial [Pristionchus fissidentatus]